MTERARTATPTAADDTGSRTRVVVIYAGVPADPSYLTELDAAVDLRVYHSDWLWGHPVAGPPAPVRARSFAPVYRSRRGHLMFLYRGLRRDLDADRPQVVHVVSEPWGLLCLQAARWARAHGARLVMHGCDTIWHHGSAVEQRVRRRLLRATLAVPGGYVAENTVALDLARANGQLPGNLTARIHTNPRDARVWRPPTEPERAAARAALGLDPGTTAVGFLGRLVPQKGLRPFLDAADRLLAGGHDVRFFVAGRGPLAAELEARRSPGVVALGALAHPDGVLGFFRALDVFACPSLRTPDWEDQGPRALLEAMMCGCVPVGSATGGIPEMMGGLGVLAATPDGSGLADAVARAAELAGRPDERARIAAAARDTYSGTAVAAQLVDLWRRLAAQVPA